MNFKINFHATVLKKQNPGKSRNQGFEKLHY